MILASNQIADASLVTVRASGQLSVADGVAETANIATLVAGSTAQGSANINIGTGSTLRLNGNLTLNFVPGAETSSGASITGTGTLELVTAAGARTLTINDGPADSDLTISATIADGGARADLTKAGAGRFTLSGASMDSGLTNSTAGVIRAASNGALGTGLGINEVQTLTTHPQEPSPCYMQESQRVTSLDHHPLRRLCRLPWKDSLALAMWW